MFGHGVFVYDPKFAIQKYSSAKDVANVAVDMGMKHAWLRVHNASGLWRTPENMALAEALNTQGISVGIWGWNDGNNVSRDIDNAIEAIRRYNPKCYIADIENGVSGASWNASKAIKFGEAVKTELADRPLVVSSFGYIPAHEPEIMAALDAYADYFAPQVYWFWFPKPYMLTPPALAHLPENNAAAYAKVCLYHWREIVTKPLVLTGQAYWGEASGWSQQRAEAKLEEFLLGFDDYGQLAGINWWNFADSKAMSSAMVAAIKGANLGGHLGAGTVSQPATNSLFGSDAGQFAIAGEEAGNRCVVAAEGLYFRSSAQGGSDENKIAELDYGEVVTVRGPILANGYQRAIVRIQGLDTPGYLHTRYLRAEEAPEIERLVQEAVSEWNRFDKGNGVEYLEPYSSYIAEMWRARGYDYLSGKDRDWYWSAAFISFILENADYRRTKLDIRHSTYIHEAIQNRITATDGDFWGYRINEAKPQVGDIVCQWRGDSETTYDKAETNSRFESHTDIIIAVRDQAVVTLGGNVANSQSGGSGVSVETKTFSLNSSGYLDGKRRVFAIMKNRFR